jgi:class 3 adenylate cyclase
VSHLELFWEHPPYRDSGEQMARHVTLIRYDKRGTGLSDRRLTDYSVEARLRDLEAVVDDLKLKKLALGGISEGGPVAIAYAAAHPRRVSHLILQGTYARPHFKTETVEALISLVRAQWGLGSETMTNIFMPGASEEERLYFQRLSREGAHREDAAAMLVANTSTDVSALLLRIKAPTLVIHARGDRAIPFEAGREVAGMIAGARLVPIESDRHSPEHEDARTITDAILDFVLERRSEERRPSAAAQSAPLTILFTDITGSTALTQSLGDEGAQDLVHQHNAIVRAALAESGGSEIKHTGDGIMASFASASRGLQCAIAIQRAVAAHTEEPPGSLLGVHVGLNAGEPIAEEDDLFGTSVQLARRICDQAAAGEILASDVVRQLVAGKGFMFADRGEVALRGFEDPVRVYDVRWRD